MRASWALSRSVFVLLVVSTAALLLASLAVSVAVGTAAAQARFAQATAIRVVDPGSPEPVRIRAHPVWTHADGRGVVAIVAEPVDPAVAPPFGLDSWPEPGQFLVSGDLLSATDELSPRFGTLAGELPQEGLPSARARIMLVRPSQPLDSRWEVAGFGVSGPLGNDDAASAGVAHHRTIDPMLSLGGVVGGLVVPAVALLATALAVARRRNARAVQVLEVLGATPSAIQRSLGAVLLRPVAVGVAIAAGVLSCAFVVDIPVPFAQFTVRSLDLRRFPLVYLAGFTVGCVVAFGLAVAYGRPGRLGAGTRPRRRPADTRVRAWLALMAAAAVFMSSQAAVATTAADMAAEVDGSGTLWLLGGSLGALLLAPLMCSGLISAAARSLVSRGRRTASAVPLILGRALQDSRRARSLASSGAVLILLAATAATWALMGSAPAVQAQRVIDRIDGRFATVSPPQDATSDDPALANLPDDLGVLTVVLTAVQDSTGQIYLPTTIYGTKAGLDHWDLAPGPIEPSQLGILDSTISDPTAPTQIALTPEPPVDEDAQAGKFFLVFRWDGDRVDRTAVQTSVSQVGGIDWDVTAGGENWIIGANNMAFEFRWIGWFAVLGGALLLTAVWYRTFEDQRRQIRTALPVDALFATTPVLPRLLAARIAVLTGTSLLVGGGAAALFARTTAGNLTTTTSSYTVLVATCLTAAIVLAGLAVPQIRSLHRDCLDWTPGADHD